MGSPGELQLQISGIVFSVLRWDFGGFLFEVFHVSAIHSVSSLPPRPSVVVARQGGGRPARAGARPADAGILPPTSTSGVSSRPRLTSQLPRLKMIPVPQSFFLVVLPTRNRVCCQPAIVFSCGHLYGMEKRRLRWLGGAWSLEPCAVISVALLDLEWTHKYWTWKANSGLLRRMLRLVRRARYFFLLCDTPCSPAVTRSSSSHPLHPGPRPRCRKVSATWVETSKGFGKEADVRKTSSTQVLGSRCRIVETSKGFGKEADVRKTLCEKLLMPETVASAKLDLMESVLEMHALGGLVAHLDLANDGEVYQQCVMKRFSGRMGRCTVVSTCCTAVSKEAIPSDMKVISSDEVGWTLPLAYFEKIVGTRTRTRYDVGSWSVRSRKF